MIITHKICMDLTRRMLQPPIQVMQDDQYSRELEFLLTANGEPWDIPEDFSAMIRWYRESDKAGGSYDTLPGGELAYSKKDNILTVRLLPEVCVNPGQVYLTVMLASASAVAHTFTVVINVGKNPGLQESVPAPAPDVYQQILGEYSMMSARVNNLASLKEGSTTGDAELIDGRTDHTGHVHTNIGSHIRKVGGIANDLYGTKTVAVTRSGSVAGEAVAMYATSLEVVGSARYLDKVLVPVQVTEGCEEVYIQLRSSENMSSKYIAQAHVDTPPAGLLQVELEVGRWFAPGERIVISAEEVTGSACILPPVAQDAITVDWLRDTPGCGGWNEETGWWIFDRDDVRFTGELIFYDTLREEMLQLEENAVSCKPQSLTPKQQAQTMENIGVEHYYHAAREEFIKPIGEITTEYTLGLYDALMDQYPGKITKNEIHNDDGTFTNYEYVISTGQYNTEGIRGTLDTDIKKPKYLVMSGIHGREKAVMMSLYRFVRDVLSGHNVPSHFLESTEIHVVPCVTPYSIDTTDRYNANGVNINRNFDWEWNKSSLTGEHAASEKETQAIVNWLNANKDARLFLDLHNSGNPHEVVMVVGLKGNEAVNMAKRTSLQGLDRVIPFWRNVIKYEAHKVPVRAGTSDEKVEVREPVFSYSSYVEGASTGGLAIHYATGKLGITSLAMETTICANADCITSELEDLAKAYSAETIAVGADAIGNILLEFYRRYTIVGDVAGDIASALDAIIQMQSPMTAEIENALDSIAEMQNSMIGVEEA